MTKAGDRRLDPAVRRYLDAYYAARPSEGATPAPETMRERHDEAERAVPGSPEPVFEYRDFGLDGGTSIRLYAPEEADRALVYVHGGGWVCGSIESFDRFCRALANRTASRVYSVGYALAPETKYPRQVEEVAAALDWVDRREPAPLFLAGDSAGGYLAVHALSSAGADTVAGLVLFHPVVDPAMSTGSFSWAGTGYRLEAGTMEWYWRQFLKVGDAGVNLLDLDLKRLPPTLMLLAGFDPLVDEGRMLAGALTAGGVDVEVDCFADQIHGFMRMGHVCDAAERGLSLVAGWLDRHRRGGPA